MLVTIDAATDSSALPSGHRIASRSTYEAARATIAELVDNGVPSASLVISATDVQFTDEAGSGMSAVIRSTLRSLFVGAAVGSLISLMLATLDWLDPLVSIVVVMVVSIGAGAFAGGSIGFLLRLADLSVRPFQPSGHMVASRFDIVTDDGTLANMARRLLR